MDAIIKKHEVERRTGRKDRKYMMDTLLETADDENAEMKLTGNGIKGLLLVIRLISFSKVHFSMKICMSSKCSLSPNNSFYLCRFTHPH